MINTDKENMDNSAQFDPGYYKCVSSIGKTFEELHDALVGSHSPNQKRARFKGVYPKVVKAVEDNIAFYLGCMLWATHLKNLGSKEILNNPCLESNYDKEGSSHEVSALLLYISEGLNRDSKYYLNTSYTPEPKHIRILEVYRDFLELNKGFHKTKNTNDIILPKNLKCAQGKELNAIVDDIYRAIEDENIAKLLKYQDMVD